MVAGNAGDLFPSLDPYGGRTELTPSRPPHTGLGMQMHAQVCVCMHKCNHKRMDTIIKDGHNHKRTDSCATKELRLRRLWNQRG